LKQSAHIKFIAFEHRIPAHLGLTFPWKRSAIAPVGV